MFLSSGIYKNVRHEAFVTLKDVLSQPSKTSESNYTVCCMKYVFDGYELYDAREPSA